LNSPVFPVASVQACASPQPLLVAKTFRTGFRDMAKRIGTRVAIACGIVRTTAADRIKHD
jgi:hypothetical protein